MKELKLENPGLSQREYMKMAAAAWKEEKGETTAKKGKKAPAKKAPAKKAPAKKGPAKKAPAKKAPPKKERRTKTMMKEMTMTKEMTMMMEMTMTNKQFNSS